MAERVTIEELQDRLLQWILRVITLAGAAAVFSVWRATDVIGQGWITVPYAIAVSTIGVLALRRSLPYRLRLYAMLVSLFAAAAVSVLAFGAGRGRPLLLIVVVLTAALAGLRASVIALALSVAVILVGAWVHVSGVVEPPLLLSSRPEEWTVAIFAFLLMGVAAVVAVGVLNRQLRDQLMEAEGMLADLRTNVKLAEHEREARDQTTRLLEGIAEHSSAVIFVKDREGRYLLANREYEAALGVPLDRVLGHTDEEVLPESSARLRANDRAVFESGKPVRSEETVRGDGGPRTFLSVKFPIIGEDGEAFAVGGISTDISDIVRAQDEVRERNALLAAVGTTATRLLTAARWEDIAGDIVQALGSATGVARCQIAQFSGVGEARTFRSRFMWGAEGVHQWADDDSLQAIAPHQVGLGPFVERLELGKSYAFNSRELPDAPRKFAEKLRMRSALTVPIISDGELWGFIGCSEQDREREWEPMREILLVAAGSLGAAISRQRLRGELEHRVDERTADLAQANSDLEAFTHSVSHDLRAPLRHASAYARLAHDAAGDSLAPAARAHLARVLEATARMTRMVSGLLEFARLGRAAIAVQPVPLEPLVRALIDERTEDVGNREVAFVTDALGSVHADPTLLRQVLANLIDNAIKYTCGTDPTTIRIAAVRQDGEIVVSVADDGVGFDPAYAGELFGVFRRLHAQSEFEGSGVGLAIVRRVIERHGGRCWAIAAPGEGATLSFALPELG